MKNASVNIVINKEQQNHLIQNYKIRPIVLEDPIPDFTEILSSAKKQEGYKMQKKAILMLPSSHHLHMMNRCKQCLMPHHKLPDVYFYVTGDKKNADKNVLIKKSDNVILTGFLDYNTYIDLLQKVDVIMDLTTDNKSIVAGAL